PVAPALPRREGLEARQAGRGVGLRDGPRQVQRRDVRARQGQGAEAGGHPALRVLRRGAEVGGARPRMRQPLMSNRPRPEVLAFLREAKEKPEDDTPRLVLADWLEENGDAADAARAELIRLGCRLARLPEDDPRRREARAREEQLLAEHAPAWR